MKGLLDFTYEEAKVEFERVKERIKATKSPFVKRDLRKYLTKLDKEIKLYEKIKKN